MEIHSLESGGYCSVIDWPPIPPVGAGLAGRIGRWHLPIFHHPPALYKGIGGLAGQSSLRGDIERLFDECL